MVRETLTKTGVPPSVLMKYSDGDTNHRTILIKVILSHIATFMVLNLDMLVATRCAPGQSWTNTAERVMPLLNIALQNVATEREKCSDEVEGKQMSHI